MAIREDINISEELETGAPSITYEGNEGPQDPQQEQKVAQLKREYMQYVFEQKDLQEPVMSFQEWYQAVYQASKMGVQAPQDQTRQPVAYGGIMGLGGRRRYGLGSRLRKLIPNEISRVAEVAAPFVAPFNPIAAGLMSGIGGWDRHGSLGKGLKSGLMNYAGGQAARYLGGADFQQGWQNPFSGGSWTSPIGSGGIKNLFKAGPEVTGASGVDKAAMTSSDIYSKAPYADASGGAIDAGTNWGTTVTEKASSALGDDIKKEGFLKGIMKNIGDAKLSTKAMMGIVGVSSLAGLYTAATQGAEKLEPVDRGVGLPGGISAIRTEVIEAFKDPTGEKLKAIRIKYPFLGAKETKNLDLMAKGGRAGFYTGGQSIPSEYTVEDARKTAMQDRLGGITDVMKRADLYRQGDIGQMYMAEGDSWIWVAWKKIIDKTADLFQ